MKFSVHTLAAALMLAGSTAFVPSNRPATSRASDASVSIKTETSLGMTFLDQLPNPFGSSEDTDVVPRPPSTPPPVSNDPEALFSRARAIMATDLGVTDPSFLTENFKWIGPNVVADGKLSKDEYLAAGRFFNVRGAFPDLDYRAHDFRLDPEDPLKVRFTARTVGTMRGELRLRSETMPPNGVRMVCPPEAISMTFDGQTGKLAQLCSGFTMDRLVGNTGGLCGVMAAATVAGAAPSEWELYPPATVVTRFFGRSVKQLKEPEKVFLAPFPETVMIQLTKGVLASELGTKDPDLLADGFTFCGPIVGPLRKKSFIDAFSSFNIRDALPDLVENYSNFRVDPYDPYRVWYDIKASGTRTGPLAGQEGNGAAYMGPPEVGSMTFDDNGFCTRLTAGAVMDPTSGNTGGLGGVFGIFYATGVPLPALTTRSLPQILSRAQKAVLSPITGEDVDDFIGASASAAATSPVVNKVIDAPETSESKTFVVKEAPVAKKPVPASKNIAVPVSPKLKVKPEPAKKSRPVAKLPKKKSPILEEQADPGTDVFSNIFGGKGKGSTGDKQELVKPQTSTKKQPVAKKEPAAKKDDVVAKQKAALRAAAEKRKIEAEEKRAESAENTRQEAAAKQAALAERKKAAEEKRRAAVAANETKKMEVETKKAAATAKQAETFLTKAKKGATISLGFLNFSSNKDDESAKSSPKAPRGVPTISNWYPNRDGSITGQIIGSATFKDGETVTTSPLKNKPESDTVVVSVSGSKYFLDENVGSAPLFNFGAPAKKAESDSVPPKATNNAAEKRKLALEASKAAAEKKSAQLEAKKLEVQRKREAALASQKERAEKAKAAALKKKVAPPAKKKVDPKATKLIGKQKVGTISLQSNSDSTTPGIFGFGASKSKGRGPPPGVPVIQKFKQNRDGSVTGFITGSGNFKEGERVTTSKLAPNQKIEAGSVVSTVSGSKYFLQ